MDVQEFILIAGQYVGWYAVRWNDRGRLKEGGRYTSWVTSFVHVWIANTSNYNVKAYNRIAMEKSGVDDQLVGQRGRKIFKLPRT